MTFRGKREVSVGGTTVGLLLVLPLKNRAVTNFILPRHRILYVKVRDLNLEH
jgi:hypothetical protein